MCYFRAATELQHEIKSHVFDHDNVVKLYAMVFEREHYGVILEYVPHGGLDDFIFDNRVSSLSLEAQYKLPFHGRIKVKPRHDGSKIKFLKLSL